MFKNKKTNPGCLISEEAIMVLIGGTIYNPHLMVARVNQLMKQIGVDLCSLHMTESRSNQYVIFVADPVVRVRGGNKAKYIMARCIKYKWGQGNPVFKKLLVENGGEVM